MKHELACIFTDAHRACIHIGIQKTGMFKNNSSDPALLVLSKLHCTQLYAVLVHVFMKETIVSSTKYLLNNYCHFTD